MGNPPQNQRVIPNLGGPETDFRRRLGAVKGCENSATPPAAVLDPVIYFHLPILLEAQFLIKLFGFGVGFQDPKDQTPNLAPAAFLHSKSGQFLPRPFPVVGIDVERPQFKETVLGPITVPVRASVMNPTIVWSSFSWANSVKERPPGTPSPSL